MWTCISAGQAGLAGAEFVEAVGDASPGHEAHLAEPRPLLAEELSVLPRAAAPGAAVQVAGAARTCSDKPSTLRCHARDNFKLRCLQEI